MSPDPTSLPCTARFLPHYQPIGKQRYPTKLWGTRGVRLTVAFLTNPGAALEARILSHLNAWSEASNVLFERASRNGSAQVRIAIEPGGHWTYVGTDIMLISSDKPTTSLDGLSLSTPEAELGRVVRYLAGHLLGFENENLPQQVLDRIDRPRAYAHLAATQGWAPPIVDALLFTPLEQHSLLGTPPQHTSIMSYQLPAHLLRDGQAYLGGANILASDHQFAGLIYPRPRLGNPL